MAEIENQELYQEVKLSLIGKGNKSKHCWAFFVLETTAKLLKYLIQSKKHEYKL